MEPCRDHPTPYPGKTRPRNCVRSSIKGQENKPSAETNDLTIFLPKRQKRALSVSKSVNTLDLSAKDKPLRCSRRLSVTPKNATPVSKTENKEPRLAVSENRSTSSKPSSPPGTSAMKSEKSLGAGAKAKSSTKVLSVSSTRSEVNDNASNKDAVVTPPVAVKSTVPLLSDHPNERQRRRLNMLMSASYWLDQIKLSESAGKHAISLGFFRLALESAAEPLQKLCDELKAYTLKYNLLEFGEAAEDGLWSYGVLEGIMSDDTNGQPVEIEASGELFLSEPRGFLTPIHEMHSVFTDDVKDGSTGETAKNMKSECESAVDIVGLSTVSGFNNVPDSLSEESEVSDLKMDKVVTPEDGNIQEPIHMGSQRESLSEKDYVMEEKAIGSALVERSILSHKVCAQNGNINIAGKTGSVVSSKINGTFLDTKNTIRNDTRSITMPGLMSQPCARKSSKINSAEKDGAAKTVRSTTRRSSTLITTTKKESCAGKSTRQDDKNGTTSNDSSHLDMPSSTYNGKKEEKDNQTSQNMNQLSQSKEIRNFHSECNENLESRPNNSTLADNGLDILKMSVDTLMGEVVSCIMSSMDDCVDSLNPDYGSVKSLEGQTRDTSESNPTENVMPTSSSSMSDVNNPGGIVHDAYSDIIGSSPILKTHIAAGHGKEEIHEDLDVTPPSRDNENDLIEDSRNRVEQGKFELNVTRSKFWVNKTVTGKGLKKDLQIEVIGNSNKENIINKSCGVTSIQTGSTGSLGKEVKGLNKSNEGNRQNPGDGTLAGSTRHSTRLRMSN